MVLVAFRHVGIVSVVGTLIGGTSSLSIRHVGIVSGIYSVSGQIRCEVVAVITRP